MLYDPKWEIEVKADPFSLESLIAWLEKQPTAKEYDFCDCNGRCLLDQYAAAMGLKNESGLYVRLDAAFDGAAGFYIAVGFPRTFGAALDRARDALDRHPA